MKKILIVEGNLREENQSFSEAGIQTHTESLKDSLAYFTDKLETDVVNPSSDENIDKNIDALESYDGLIWGGSSLNIYNNTPEIKRQIDFMKECQKKIKKILAICWGMQVAVTAAGGEVKKATKGSHRGIASNIEINEIGLNHPLYKNKDEKLESNSDLLNIACLMIHAARIDENYTDKEKNIIKKIYCSFLFVNIDRIFIKVIFTHRYDSDILRLNI